MERYEEMFRWNSATEHYYGAARIGEGQFVADFGCGPGHAAVEFAKRTGPRGHVHAFDINAKFIERTRQRAAAEDLGNRISAHLLTSHVLPLADHSVDRVIARNTIIYVEDPLATFREFRRALRPGGIAHVIEGDWRLTAVEPVPTDDWRALVEAAIDHWPRPEIGRQLCGFLRWAGFDNIELQVLTSPDRTGRLKGMIQTVAGYARSSGRMSDTDIDAILDTVDKAIDDGLYLAIAPQFVATAKA
jgi:SAM-dependent methyltransferase